MKKITAIIGMTVALVAGLAIGYAIWGSSPSSGVIGNPPPQHTAINYRSLYLNAAELKQNYGDPSFNRIIIGIKPNAFPTDSVVITAACLNKTNTPFSSDTFATSGDTVPLPPLNGWNSIYDSDLYKPSKQIEALLLAYPKATYFLLKPEKAASTDCKGYFDIQIIACGADKKPLETNPPDNRVNRIDPIPPGGRY